MVIKQSDIDNFDNPYVQVIWEDSAENFSQEKIKSVKQYFQKKYNSTNINIITKTKFENDVDQVVDTSFNVLDENYLKNLIKSFLKSNDQEAFFEKVLKIDSMVDNKMILNNIEITPFKKWFIKRIEFSNFLSFGENNVLDFENLNGITVVQSTPRNFGGKTILSVDLLLFIFFNTTSRTQKAEDIFNKFTDKDKVTVKAEIEIDGDNYIISRQIERKLNRSKEFNYKTDLEFFKKLPNGELQNFTGEQRKETEEFIKSSIGDMDDFLMTILTTGSNLEDLLEAKPTARGQVLSRFLGLDFIKKKEEMGKEIYSEFSKGMISNVYNSEKLKQEIEEKEKSIVESKEIEKKLNIDIVETDGKIKIGSEYRDSLLKSKHVIDRTLAIINPDELQRNVDNLLEKRDNVKIDIENVIIKEPSSFYHETEHDKIKDEILNLKLSTGKLDMKIDDINRLVKKFGEGIECEHCGIKLMDAKITKDKIGELGGFEKEKKKLDKNLLIKIQVEQSYVSLKKEFDEYEKNKLIKERHELTLEKTNFSIKELEEKQKKYFEIQEKIKENNKTETQIMKSDLRLNDLKSEKIKYESHLVLTKTVIDSDNKKIESNKKLIETITSESEKEKEYKIYLECFGKNGISKIIMKTMMPVINSEIQRLLQESCYFNLKVDINDRNEVEFIMIDNSSGVEKLMTSGSGYEKTIASLALRSVLSKICSLPKPNIIVMDEIFGKISDDNLEMVGEFFTKIKEYFENIFIITHNPLVNNWADHTINIKKEDNVSSLI